MANNINTWNNYCNGCKQGLGHGDQVVIVKNLKFFHLSCYKRKNCFFKLFNSIKSFLIWYDSKIVMEEVNAIANDLIAKLRPLQKLAENEMINAQTQVTAAVEPEFASKIDMELNNLPNEIKNITFDCDDIPIEDVGKDGSGDGLTVNLDIIRQELYDLRDKINYFSEEREKDEELIEKLKKEIAYYRKERNDYLWLINYRKSINKFN